MPTGRRSSTGPTGPLAAALLLLVVLALGSCTARDAGTTSGARAGSPSGTPRSTAPPARAVRDVVAEVRHALARRAAAVRHGDAAAFRAGLAPRAAFLRGQRTYLANLEQLPLSRFRYVVDPADVDALDRPGTQGAAARARVLHARTGLDAARLADRAGGLILTTYTPVAAQR